MLTICQNCYSSDIQYYIENGGVDGIIVIECKDCKNRKEIEG